MPKRELPFQSVQVLRALYNTLPDPVIITSAERIVLGVNRAAEAELGMTEKELLGISSGSLFASPEDADTVARKIFSEAFGDEQFHARVSLRRKDRSTFVCELSVSRILDDDGRRIGQVAVVRNISEMLAAESERLQLERILSSGLATLKEGFVVYDHEDRLLVCNDAYRDIYALSAPVIVKGNTFESILRYGLERGQYPEAGETKTEQEAFLHDRLRRHRGPHESVIQQVAGNRWIQIEEKITADGLRVGLRTDITNLRRIRSETERLGRIIDTVRQEIYIIDMETCRFTYANRGACDNLGYRNGTIREADPASISPALSRSGLAGIKERLSAGTESHIEKKDLFCRADGSRYPARLRFELMALENGDRALIAFVEDISGQIAVEQELERRRYEFETLVRNIPDAITRAKPDTTLTYVNEHYAAFLGKTPEQMVGTRFSAEIPVHYRERALKKIYTLTPENPIDTFEQPMIDHAGRRYWYLWSNLMTFENGEAREIVSVGRDITEGREARDRIARQSHELQRRNEALEQFAGIVSHDLKAPLRQIRLFADMIAEDAGDGRLEELPQLSSHISDGVSRMERMVNSLLSYSKLAYQTLNPVRVSLPALVSAAWANLTAQVREKNAGLSIRGNVALNADSELLQLLFQNLFGNALKYVAPNVTPRIAVSAVAEEDRVTIHVEDNGIGIEPQYHETVFGVFMRLHKDERIYPGTGIGLALCRRVAESHGGALSIDPDYRNGTRFVLVLPRGEV